MRDKIKIVLLTLIIGMFFISCSDDDSSTGPEQTAAAKELEINQIDIPAKMKQVQDSKAVIVNAWINAANSFQSYTLWFQVPQNASLGKTNGDRTYTWTRGSLNVTMYYSESSSDISWRLVLNGSEDGYVYTNWTFMEASQTVDKKNGWMKVYKENSTEVESEWSWNTDANGKYTFIMNSSLDDFKIEITSNPDLSGELNYYNNNVRISRTVWDKDGNGQWWEYDSSGNITDSGSWTTT